MSVVSGIHGSCMKEKTTGIYISMSLHQPQVTASDFISPQIRGITRLTWYITVMHGIEWLIAHIHKSRKNKQYISCLQATCLY